MAHKAAGTIPRKIILDSARELAKKSIFFTPKEVYADVEKAIGRELTKGEKRGILWVLKGHYSYRKYEWLNRCTYFVFWNERLLKKYHKKINRGWKH